jgi:hypothetical protein
MKKSKSYLKGLTWTAIALAGAFFVLPAIFPEDAAVIDQKLSAEAAAQEAGAAALPVVFSDNPLSKFFKKLSKFYGFGKKTPAEVGSDVSFSDEREVFPLRASAEDSPEVSFGQEGGSPAAGPMIFTAADGTEIHPDANGYTYDGQYYSNGEYPSEDLKKSIENAIARYHTSASASQGLKPVYVQNPDGSLKVQYVSDQDYDRYMGGATMGADGNPQSQFFASSNKYSGARLASKEGATSFSKSGSDEGKGFGSLSAEDTSLSGRFATLNTKLDQNKKDTAKEAEEQQKKEKEEFEKNKWQLLNSASKFQSFMYVDPSAGKRTVPTYNADKFKGKPLVIDASFVFRFAKSFGVEESDFNTSLRKTTLTQDPREKEQDFAKNILEQVKEDKVFKVISGQTGGQITHAVHHIKKEYGDDNVYFDHIGVPVNDPDKKLSERKSFTDTFFKDTGLKDVLTAADVKQDKIDAIEAEYQKLDESRKAFTATLKEVVAKDPNLKSLKTSTTFLLGKDDNNNLVVATPKSFLYVYSTSAPAWIAEKYKQDTERAYISVPVEEVTRHLKDNGTVTVVTNKEAEQKIIELGANTVANISNKYLSSFTPAAISSNMEILSGKIMQETTRVAQSSQKASLEEAQKLIAETKKSVKDKPKGVNASAKSSGKGTQKNQPPLALKKEQPKYIWTPQNPFNGFTNNSINQTKGKGPLLLQTTKNGNASKATGSKK